MSDILVRVDGVSKKFCRSLKKSLWYGMKDLGREITGHRHGGNGELRPDEFWAVKDVSFELKRGECLGLVGHNGAGKTTLLKMLNGLVKPDSGKIEMRGRVGAIIALGAGFNPILTGRENIYVNGSVLGLSKQEIDRKIDQIIDFSEIEEFIDMPVQSYSSGMTVRLGFSIASSINPDVLILDEVLAVGDSNFQNKCIRRIGEIVGNSAVIVVSHQAHQIAKLCDSALYLERGRFVKAGPTEQVLQFYQSRNKSPLGSIAKLLDPVVESIDAEITEDEVRWGKSLDLLVSICLINSVFCVQGFVNILDSSENIHAQVRLADVIGSLNPGRHKIRISIGPLFLVTGSYQVSLQLYGGDKRTLAVVRRFAEFALIGPANLGVSYSPPAKVSFD